MESPSRTLTLSPPHHSLRRRRSSSDSVNSPEFEFSNTGCDSQSATLVSADELFSDGFLLPLHRLHPNQSKTPEPDTGPIEPEPSPSEPDSEHEPEPGPEPSAMITSNNPILTASKRWREIFKRTEKKPGNESEIKVEKTEKSREKERKNARSSSSSNNSSAELNINIWPFSRSRSAGNNSGRARPAVQSNRKVSSAPCSRSNSSGESKTSRKSWPSSPGRAGVHLGRASPVWQVRKPVSMNRTPNGGGSGKGRVLKLNVPVCIGYRQSLSCRSEESGGDSGGGGMRSGGNGGGNGNNNMFSLRGLFSKKTTVLTV